MASRRRCRTPRSSPTGCDRARRDRDGHRGAPAGRAHQPVRGRGPRAATPHLLPTFVGAGGEAAPNPRRPATTPRNGPGRGRGRRRLAAPRRSELVARLARSRCSPRSPSSSAGTPATTRSSSASRPGLRLTDAEERRALRRSPSATSKRSPTTTSTRSGYDKWLVGPRERDRRPPRRAGPAAQGGGGGGVRRGLVKVVFATETLSLGINMPARSVVIEKLSKFTGEHHEFLTPGEYTQLTGRAGRRGIDDVGYAVVSGTRSCRSTRWRGSRRGAPPRSRRRSGPPTTWRRTSCAATRPNRPPPPQPVVRAVPRRPGRRGASNASSNGDASCSPSRGGSRRRGDVEEYRRCRRDRAAAARDTAHATEAPRPAPPRRRDHRARGGGRAVVLKHESGRGGGRVLGSPTARLVRLGTGRLPRPGPHGRDIELPSRSRRATSRSGGRAAEALRRVRLHDVRGARRHRRRVDELQAALAAHPCTARRARRRPRGRGQADRHSSRHARLGAGSEPDETWPASSTACSACSSRGATSTGGRSPRPASC